MTEWRDIPGYEGYYQVSDDGQVKSLRRKTERLLRLQNHPNGYKQVNISGLDGRLSSRLVHQLVALAFLGPKPFVGAEVCHNDGTRTNNRAENLRWGTHRDNIRDCLLHGTNPNVNKTRCPQGHEYTPENTYLAQRGEDRNPGRHCQECLRTHRREFKHRKREAARSAS